MITSCKHKTIDQLQGFTLLELLVAISIIVILLGLLFPSLSRAREKTKAIKCLSNIRQIGIAIEAYKSDNSNRLAPGSIEGGSCVGWAGRYFPYVKSIPLFCCPTDEFIVKEEGGKKKYALTYFFNFNLGTYDHPDGFHESDFSSAAHTILLADNTGSLKWAPRHDPVELENPEETDSFFANDFYQDDGEPYNRHLNGRNFLMADGHIAWLTPSKLSMGDVDRALPPSELTRGIVATMAY